MDIEKLIEQANRFGMELKRDGGEFEYSIGEKFLDYATALSTLQAENAQLRGELEYEREHANAYHEECGQWEAENEKLREKIEDARLEGYAKGLCEMSEENEKLRADVVRFNDMLASYQNVLVPELRAELEQKEKYYEQMVDALAATESAELEQVKRERDAAVDCIYQIEDDLDRGSDNDWAREHISEWESQKED